MTSPASRIDALDWPRIEADLAARGCAVTGQLFTPEECAALMAMYNDGQRFRSRVVMQRHGFGQGEYQYFAYPLPKKLDACRGALYERLAPLANAWAAAMGQPADYPQDHAAYLARCHAAGQLRPTPLLLRYGEGDYNCLHQDLYGELQFPLQLTVLLSVPGQDFTGGEFVLTEQRPRMQSRAEVVPLAQGEAVIFAVNQRPVARTRLTLGLIFHDAR
jgi:hypothetical protein